MTFNSDEIVLPCNITDEIQKIITKEKINSSLVDVSYLHHLYQIRWVAKQFWSMKRYYSQHPRKIDTLTKCRNFPSDWLQSSMNARFDDGLCPFSNHYRTILRGAVLDPPHEF